MLRLTNDQELVDALSRDWRNAVLTSQDHQMLLYAEKLTLKPWEMTESDIIALREVGFSDAAILDIAQVTSYFAFVNRIADGLGVEVEPELQHIQWPL